MTAAAPAHVERVLSGLKKVTRAGDGWKALCPAHEDRIQSLSLKVGRDGRLLMKCHAGCETDGIVGALGLSLSDLFADDRPPTPGNGHSTAPLPVTRPILVKTYDYTDEAGTLLYQVCRYEPKDFRPRVPTGDGEWQYKLPGEVRRVLYRLPSIVEAVSMGRTVFLVEGEKDADTLADLGYPATTWQGGAQNWRDEFAAVLKGSDVVCLPDNDDPGRTAMQKAASALAEHDVLVKVVELPGLPAKGDVTDWLDDGHDLDELFDVVGKTPTWVPDPSTRVCWRLDELWANDTIMRPPPPVVPRIAWSSRSTLLAAAEKSGKSTVSGFLAAQVSNGGEFLGDPCASGPVLIVGLEEFIGDCARRLQHFRANPKRVHIIAEIPGDPHQRPQVIRSHIERVQPALVIVDTLMAYSEGIVNDATSSSQMQPVVQSLTNLAHTTGVALILVHHARKSDGKYRDSSAIGGAVDAIIEVFLPDENGDPRLRRARARGRMPLHSFDFRFDGDTFSLVSGDEAPLELRIVEFIRSRPGCSANDVAEGVTGNRQRTLNTIATLTATRHLLRDAAGRKYFVPGSQPPTMFPPDAAA